jgi:co-chaperonin GroES (HSP10)
VEGVEEGDVVYYDKHAGHGIQHKDKFYGVIKQQDVVLID